MLLYDIGTGRMSMVVKDSGSVTLDFENYALGEGDIVYFTVDPTLENEHPTIQKTITEFPEGKVIIELTPEDTDVEPGNYKYDVQLNYNDGRVDTVLGPSKFIFKGGVTY